MNTASPTSPIQALSQLAQRTSLFPLNSRYHGIDTLTLETSDGRKIPYLARRFIPSPDTFKLVQQYAVLQGDRLDNLAARFFGDPELYWRLCDANLATRPDDLVDTVGRILRITLPENILGTS